MTEPLQQAVDEGRARRHRAHLPERDRLRRDQSAGTCTRCTRTTSPSRAASCRCPSWTAARLAHVLPRELVLPRLRCVRGSSRSRRGSCTDGRRSRAQGAGRETTVYDAADEFKFPWDCVLADVGPEERLMLRQGRRSDRCRCSTRRPQQLDGVRIKMRARPRRCSTAGRGASSVSEFCGHRCVGAATTITRRSEVLLRRSVAGCTAPSEDMDARASARRPSWSRAT